MRIVHSSPEVVQRERLLRLAQVEFLVGLRKSAIYAAVKAGTFPSPIRLSRRCSLWPESKVLTWIQSQVKQGAQA